MSEKEAMQIPTPFGEISIPFPKIPKFESPKIDERRSKALGHAIAIDLSGIIALVPLVGDVVADFLEDNHGAELRKTVTPTEYDTYTEHDKVAPSVVALIRTFMEE